VCAKLRSEPFWLSALQDIPIRFQHGALRLTRTPGRTASNTITLEQLIHAPALCSAFVSAFFIADFEFLSYFPFTPTGPFSRQCAVPLYIGRDLNMDPVALRIAERYPPKVDPKTKKEGPPKPKEYYDDIVKEATTEYTRMHGEQYHAVYADADAARGCVHSKILVLVSALCV
jgi:hypothetical protein